MTQLVTIQDLEQFKKELLIEIRTILDKNSQKKWLKSKDVRKLLGISAGTLQAMRNNNEIPFTRIGGVIYYLEESVNEYLLSKETK